MNGPSHPADAFERELWSALEACGAERAEALRALAAKFPQQAAALEALAHEPGPAAPAVQERIGPYVIERPLGEGGMGRVLLARQEQPIARLVAVKVIKRGMDSAQILGRFQLERQVLAMMDHPCIATVFDAGLAETGQPYFAMEYVPGVPITEYCDQQRASLPDRIELFLQVCAGVEHAHQKGVLHRDLKPSNILVVEQDGRPLPKIIDFGLARLLAAGTDGHSMFTAAGQFVGTVEYMSPEQVGLDVRGVDTRSDVYSLGVVLFQLLVGDLPFGRRHLRGSEPWLDRSMFDEQPRRPSTRLTELGQAATALAHCRQLEVAALHSRLRADLDWVVLKALERDRERRYGSPRELADDLRRYLAHQPVLASPPSVWYRWSKFVRRHRGAVTAAAVALVIAIAGGTSTWQQAAAKASALDRFLLLARGVELTEVEREETALYPAMPERAPAMRAWLRDRAEPQIAHAAELRRALEQLRTRATRLPAAEAEALSAGHARAAELASLRAELHSKEAQLEVAEGTAAPASFAPDASEALSAKEIDDRILQLLGPTAQAANWGREAEALALARLSLRKVDDGDPSLGRIRALASLAQACWRTGLVDEAMTCLETALPLVPPGQREGFATSKGYMRQRIEQLRAPEHRTYLADLQEKVQSLSRIVELDVLRFADDGERFVYENLVRLIERLRAFASSAGPVAAVRARVAEAESVRRKTVDAHREPWQQAVEAIAAHAAYRGLRIEPQLGLVPLGPDPVSGLQEFVHTASGDGTGAIPQRDEAGRLRLDPKMGIVLVLLPGGRQFVGAQRTDPDRPLYDRFTAPEHGVREVEIAPFLLGKYEVTQMQWARLVRGTFAQRFPSALRIGRSYGGLPMLVSELHPVESIDQGTAATWLERAGLRLPTEVEWEHGCRAGSVTPWYTGDEPGSLAGHANVFDEDAGKVGGTHEHEAFADGCAPCAPIGFYKANPFGLHDVHGNVAEWMLDRYRSMADARGVDTTSTAFAPRVFGVQRGGSAVLRAQSARSGERLVQSVQSQEPSAGCRAAMTLQSR